MRSLRRNPQLPPPPVQLPGPHLLWDRGLLARWYILHRLEEEMARAKRYGYPLTVAALEPLIPSGHPAPVAVVAVGAQSAEEVSRSSDLLGWLDDQRILIILPHVDGVQAASTIDRWRGEMSLRSWHLGGGVKWRIAASTGASEYATGAAFLEAAQLGKRAA